MFHSVPKATLQRYPIYLKALRNLKEAGITKIMSRELARYVDVLPTTIRRDFSLIGHLGKQGYGSKFGSSLYAEGGTFKVGNQYRRQGVVAESATYEQAVAQIAPVQE